MMCNLNKKIFAFRKSFALLVLTFIVQLLPAQPDISDKKVNFGWRNSSNRKVNTVIIHSTFNNSGGEHYDIDLIIKQFKIYNVSPHYLIGRDGSIYRMVDEKNAAFHAGKSKLPDGTTNLNERSIGIEVVTSFTEKPTPEQIQSLVKLVNDIRKRFKIKYILRHSDIAPGRKTDPWNFDWKEFLELLETDRKTEI